MKKKARTEAQKAADFKRLANIRGKRALRAIGGLAALAKPGRYSFTANDVKTMEGAFKKALGDTFAAFDRALKAPEGEKAADAVANIL